MFPERQTHPHKTWADEVEYLDKLFTGGSAYVVGKVNGDHWNLYMTAPTEPSSPDSPGSSGSDQTLEILMTELDSDKCRLFNLQQYEQPGPISGRRAELQSGLSKLLPGALLDSHLFSPCGYSLNGILNDTYLTVHVTPEPECSFASFECNANVEDIDEMVKKVVNVFMPGKFSVTVFRSTPAIGLDMMMKTVEGWKRADRIVYEFEGYKLWFEHYNKP